MKWMVSMVAGSVGGGIGWWVGAKFGVMTAFFLSVIGTAIAVYYAKRWVDELLP